MLSLVQVLIGSIGNFPEILDDTQCYLVMGFQCQSTLSSRQYCFFLGGFYSISRLYYLLDHFGFWAGPDASLRPFYESEMFACLKLSGPKSHHSRPSG